VVSARIDSSHDNALFAIGSVFVRSATVTRFTSVDTGPAQALHTRHDCSIRLFSMHRLNIPKEAAILCARPNRTVRYRRVAFRPSVCIFCTSSFANSNLWSCALFIFPPVHALQTVPAHLQFCPSILPILPPSIEDPLPSLPYFPSPLLIRVLPCSCSIRIRLAHNEDTVQHYNSREYWTVTRQYFIRYIISSWPWNKTCDLARNSCFYSFSGQHTIYNCLSMMTF